MDIKRLTRGEQILGGAAALLLISSFLSLWAKVEVSGGGIVSDASARANAWDAYDFFPLKLAFLVALIAIVWVVLRAANVSMSLPWPAGMVALVLGALTLLLVLVTLLTGPAGPSGGFGFEVSRGPLLFVAVVLAAAMAYGGYLAYQEDQSGSATYGGPAAPPPGPPPPA